MNGPRKNHASNGGTVHIVLSDRGWILERLGKELSDRLPYVSYSLDPDPDAAIQYYVTYGSRRERVSPVEVALFTHREDDPAAAARFDEVARDVDHAIAMSNATSRLIADLGVADHSCITPGVDFERFRPKLKIGVVGRTYHTGRKGEALVRAVLDVPDIEWHFTGAGWPGPAAPVDEADLPAFYRSMDYILVPALNEGGPMSVLEALASGVQVIASPVGWASDFPHIPFERGDAESLRRVLMRLREDRLGLRASVEHMTWERWAEEHDALFQRLFKNAGSAEGAPAAIRRVRSAALVTHGQEDTTLGGPSVRVPATARALRALNLDVRVTHNQSAILNDVDVVHAFNLWAPRTAVAVARDANRRNKPLVFSPIMLDLSEGPLWQADLLRAFRSAKTGAEAEALMARFVRKHEERMSRLPQSEPEPGYRDILTEISELSNGLIFLSRHEERLFRGWVGNIATPSYLIHNPVDADLFDSGDPSLFREAYGVEDYVLCIARIEHRKNQLMLALALRDAGIPLVLIGHVADQEYLSLIKRFAGPDLIIVDRLDPGSEMLRSAIAGARVFALPSWAEGAPLAALEAGAAGANLVLSDRSGEREYFGDHARYCDPGSVESIREAVTAAWDEPITEDASRGLAAHVKENFSWERYADETLAVYEDVYAQFIKHRAAAVQKRPSSLAHFVGPRQVVMDVTTWVRNPKTVSGIVRVERSIAKCLLECNADRAKVNYICFISSAAGFVRIPEEIIANDILNEYLENLTAADSVEGNIAGLREAIDPNAGGDLFSVGSAWMQNPEYAPTLHQFSRAYNLKLSILMHDMTPTLFPHWYPAGYSEVWDQNCLVVVMRADRLLVYSDSTKKDIAAFAANHGVDLPAVEKIRLADEIGTLDDRITKEGEDARRFFQNRPFVLSVGAVHIRKNYGLLYDVWLILREKMGDACPHLAIVGGVAWNAKEIAHLIREDHRVNKYIHILERIDDLTLDWLYSNSLLTAYPSLYEGWGLPVGESLAHGKICISSDSSSMREIAPALTDLIDPFDRIRWAAMIQHYASSASTRAFREAQIREAYAVTTWDETTNGILEAFEGEIHPPTPRPYNLGEIVRAARGTSGDETYFSAGWFQLEAWGCWSNNRHSKIEFALVHAPTEDLILTVLARVLKPAKASRRCIVRVNGVVVGNWHFPALGEHGDRKQDVLVNRARIPMAVAQSSSSLSIDFELDQLCPVKEVAPGSVDERSMGMGLVAFMVESQSLSCDPAVLFSTRNDVRKALGAGPTTDVVNALTTTAYRPSPLPDVWIRNFQLFARVGLRQGDVGIISEKGQVRLSLGMARIRLDRDTQIEFVIDAPAATVEQPVKIAVFVNDTWVESVERDTSELGFCSVSIPLSLMTRSDPLTVSFRSTELAGKPAEFVVSAFRLAQETALPSEQHHIVGTGRMVRLGSGPAMERGSARFLSDGWYSVESTGAWSIGPLGRLLLSIDPTAPRPSVLAIRLSCLSSGRDDDKISVLGADGAVLAEVSFPATPKGSLHAERYVMVSMEHFGASLPYIDIRLKPNNPAWPALFSASPEIRRLGVRLISFGFYELSPLSSGSGLSIGLEKNDSVVFMGGWHEPEEVGRWTERADAALLIRVEGEDASVLTLSGYVLPGIARETLGGALTVAVDSQANPAKPVVRGEGYRLDIELEPSSDGCHLIEFSNMVRNSPAALGLGPDGRVLGLHVASIELDKEPATESDDDVGHVTDGIAYDVGAAGVDVLAAPDEHDDEPRDLEIVQDEPPFSGGELGRDEGGEAADLDALGVTTLLDQRDEERHDGILQDEAPFSGAATGLGEDGEASAELAGGVEPEFTALGVVTLLDEPAEASRDPEIVQAEAAFPGFAVGRVDEASAGLAGEAEEELAVPTIERHESEWDEHSGVEPRETAAEDALGPVTEPVADELEAEPIFPVAHHVADEDGVGSAAALGSRAERSEEEEAL